jgi:metal-responsive CopG/Arc/MetJ family transcriptional regulator
MPRTKAIKIDEPERKQTGVKLDLELWREFKSIAVRRGSTATELLEEAMRDYLKKTTDREREKAAR